MIPVVLTIAGSDSSAGAGIQADLKAIAANGGYGASVITAITAQNTRAVTRAAPLDLDLVRAQLDAVFDDLPVAAVKMGMLASAAIVGTVASALREHGPPPCVLDPVMVSKTGFVILEPDAVAAMVQELVPLVALVTPNVHEAEVLTGIRVGSLAEAEGAGRRLLEAGAAAVLVKGGHLERGPATDVLVTPRRTRFFRGERLPVRHTHGSGCTYSAAIATQLAHGHSLEEAIVRAKAYITEAIRAGLPIGRGIGPTDHFFYLRRPGACDAWMSRAGWRQDGVGRPPLGRLHVITDVTLQTRFSHAELARLAANGGADVVQLREKRALPTRALVEAATAVSQALEDTETTLVVDDRADVAVAVGARALHLGRDDLDPATARRLLGPGALIGGTANDLDEAIRVAAAEVDYLGVGPVFGTSSKADPAPPLGLDGLRAIVRAVPKPVVAVGGIEVDHVEAVLDAGAHGLAVLSAVVCQDEPERATRAFRQAVDAWLGAKAA